MPKKDLKVKELSDDGALAQQAVLGSIASQPGAVRESEKSGLSGSAPTRPPLWVADPPRLALPLELYRSRT